MKEKQEETKEKHSGRTGIGHQNRDSRSKRAAEMKIRIEKIRCKKCGHKKAMTYTNIESPYQGTRKCTKCKKRTTK